VEELLSRRTRSSRVGVAISQRGIGSRLSRRTAEREFAQASSVVPTAPAVLPLIEHRSVRNPSVQSDTSRCVNS
jgi:hypothetical protein